MPASVPSTDELLKSPRWPIRKTRSARGPKPFPSDRFARCKTSRRNVSAECLSGSRTAVSEEEYSVSLRHWISNPHCSTARRVASAARSFWGNNSSIPTSSIRSRATVRPCRRLVEGVYGKNPVAFDESISSQPRKLRGSLAFFDASIALSEIALKASPGGNIRPFCDPPPLPSPPHSSCHCPIHPTQHLLSTTPTAPALPLS